MSWFGCRGILGVEDAVLNPTGEDSGAPSDAASDTSADSAQPVDAEAGIEAQADTAPPDASSEEIADTGPDASPLSKLTCKLVLPQHWKLYEASGPAFFLDNVYGDSLPSRNQMRVVIEQEGTVSRTHYVSTVGPAAEPDAAALWMSTLNYTHYGARLHGAITTEDPPGNSVALLSWRDQNNPPTEQYNFYPARIPADFPAVENTVDPPIFMSSAVGYLEVTSVKMAVDGTKVHFVANYSLDQMHYAWIPPYITLASSDVAAEVALTQMVRIGTDNHVFVAGGAKGPEQYVVNDLAAPPIDPNYFASQGVEMLAASRSSDDSLNVALRDVVHDILYLGQLNPAAAKKLQLSYLKAFPIASITTNPIPTAKVAWIGDELVMIGPTTDDGSLSILWLDMLGRVRAEGPLGNGSGGKVWKVLAARQSFQADSAEVHVAWTERTQLEAGPLLDIVWYNQIRCDSNSP